MGKAGAEDKDEDENEDLEMEASILKPKRAFVSFLFFSEAEGEGTIKALAGFCPCNRP
jgi:hypothetical protein